MYLSFAVCIWQNENVSFIFSKKLLKESSDDKKPGYHNTNYRLFKTGAKNASDFEFFKLFLNICIYVRF